MQCSTILVVFFSSNLPFMGGLPSLFYIVSVRRLPRNSTHPSQYATREVGPAKPHLAGFDRSSVVVQSEVARPTTLVHFGNETS
jgi:hypothetical protein